jgi:hypothetical protein
VKRGNRIVGVDTELVEKLGRNDLCPCGSGRRFPPLLPENRPFRRSAGRLLRPGLIRTDAARFVLVCRRQGLPGLPWCAGVPVRRACRTGTVPPGGGADRGSRRRGEREPSRDARMPPGSGTGLRDGRAAGRVPADPGRSGAGRRTPARNHRAGRGSGRRPDARERRGGAGRRGPGSPGYRGVQEGAVVRCVAPGRAITLSDT